MRGSTIIRISPPDSRAVYKLYYSAEALLPRAENKSRTILWKTTTLRGRLKKIIKPKQ